MTIMGFLVLNPRRSHINRFGLVYNGDTITGPHEGENAQKAMMRQVKGVFSSLKSISASVSIFK